MPNRTYAVFGSFAGATLTPGDVARLSRRSDATIEVINAADPIKVRCTTAAPQMVTAIARMCDLIGKHAAAARLTNVNAVDLSPQSPQEAEVAVSAS